MIYRKQRSIMVGLGEVLIQAAPTLLAQQAGDWGYVCHVRLGKRTWEQAEADADHIIAALARYTDD